MSPVHRALPWACRCAVALVTGRALAGTTALAQGAPASTGPAVIVGRVLDAAERPLAGVEVAFEDTEIATRTGAAGTFALHIDFVPDGVVVFRQVGFAPARASVRLARGDTVRLVARLARLDVLDTVRTTSVAAPAARLAGFEARRTSGRGVYVTQAEIERRNPVSAADVLRASGAVRVVDSLGTLLATSARGGRWDARHQRFDAACVMRLAVDGILRPAGTALDELPSPKEIAGVEIYRGAASFPAEFAGARADGPCGLIVVWTR